MQEEIGFLWLFVYLCAYGHIIKSADYSKADHASVKYIGIARYHIHTQYMPLNLILKRHIFNTDHIENIVMRLPTQISQNAMS